MLSFDYKSVHLNNPAKKMHNQNTLSPFQGLRSFVFYSHRAMPYVVAATLSGLRIKH